MASAVQFLRVGIPYDVIGIKKQKHSLGCVFKMSLK
jgi:hypothetical protein